MKKILSLLFISSSIFSMQLDLVKQNKTHSVLLSADKLTPVELNSLSKVYINRKAVFAPERLGSVELCHSKKGFSVLQNNKKHAIKKYFTDPMVRDITREQLGAFLQGGYLSVNQMNDGEFSLKANGRIKGGGPMLGAFMYWATKSVCYGTAAAAVGTVVVTTGGAISGAVGAAAVNSAGAAVLTTAGTSTVGTVIGTTAGTVVGTAAAGGVVATGAGGVAAAIGGASLNGAVVGGVTLAQAASYTTVVGATAVSGTSAAASVGTAAATVMAIESVSAAVGTFFGMLPTP